MEKQSKKLITHNGSFHSDDIFAAATLMIYLESKGETFEIIRTRDEEIIKSGDYVFDVGGVHDEATNRFDHHQKGGAGEREGAIPFAAFGLVWKKFGVELCGSVISAEAIEKRLVSAIDAWDNGFSLVENKYEVTPYFIQHAFLSMQPTWKEGEEHYDAMFLKSVEIAKEILKREITHAQDGLFAEEIVVGLYNNAVDKRIIILDKNYPFQETLNKFPEPVYVIYFKESSNHWMVKAVSKILKTFENRKDFPATWGGLKDEELQKITGVPDAIFCHRGLFLAVAKSREGAIKLAQIAVES